MIFIAALALLFYFSPFWGTGALLAIVVWSIWAWNTPPGRF
jgi:hypothetical protein